MFAADEDEPDTSQDKETTEATATEACVCPIVTQIVEVGFTDNPKAPALFGGMRKQYVNLTDVKVRKGDLDITSDNQVGRTPPIMVRVTPPKATTVRIRLRRTLHRGGFPAGSSKLSGREEGQSHLTYARSVSTHTTDAKGVLLLEPGKEIAALGGGEYKVEASLPGKAWVPGSNSVRIKRRVYIRPVVRYAAGAAAAQQAINAIRADLAPLDIDVKVLPKLDGAELGVVVTDELPVSLENIGKNALDDTTNHLKDLRPHSVAIIVGQFGDERSWLPAHTFQYDVTRDPGTGQFPASMQVQLADSTAGYILVPLTNGSHFLYARVAHGSRTVTLTRDKVTDLGRFTDTLTVDLTGIGASFPGLQTVRLSVRVIAISGWGVGWAYNAHPVIYLNMRDPNTNTILAAERARALVIHELGHKLHLVAPGDGGQPDKQKHHYPSFNTNGVQHVGPHCSYGVPTGTSLWLPAAQTAAKCTMWGSLKGVVQFCDECKTSLRKIDIAGGF